MSVMPLKTMLSTSQKLAHPSRYDHEGKYYEDEIEQVDVTIYRTSLSSYGRNKTKNSM